MLNPGSERNLIAICLSNEDKIMDVETAEITPEHFGIPGNKYIFMALSYLYSKSIKPSPMSIMEVTTAKVAKDSIDELGGLEYLMIIEGLNVPEDNLSIFIEKIKQSYTRRKLLDISFDMESFVTSEKAGELNPQELIHFVDEKISDLTVNTTVSDEFYKMGDSTEEVLRLRAENPSQVPGLEVGWEEYDRLTNGAVPGDLIVVTAPSKVGKSTTLTNWATKIAIKDRIPILYFDTEMNERDQEDRILANLTGIPQSEIVSGMYVLDTEHGKSEDKINRLKLAREELNMGEYYHVFMPHFTAEKVMAIARKFVLQFGVKAIFFDYIKMPSSADAGRNMQEYQMLGFFTSALKEMAGILNVPVFTAAQTNRMDLDTTSPDASNIGGSYRILQLASKLLFLVNKSDEQIAKDGYQNGNQQLLIKYQRNGASDCDPINVMFKKEILRQQEV